MVPPEGEENVRQQRELQNDRRDERATLTDELRNFGSDIVPGDCCKIPQLRKDPFFRERGWAVTL